MREDGQKFLFRDVFGTEFMTVINPRVEKNDYKFAIDVLKDALHKYFKARGFSFEERELAREFTSNVMNRIHEFCMKIDIKELSDIGRIQAIVVIDAMGLEHSIELETILISLFSGVLSELEKLD